MGQLATHERPKLDRELDHALREWEWLPDVAAAYDEWPEDVAMDFVFEWSLEEDRFLRFACHAERGSSPSHSSHASSSLSRSSFGTARSYIASSLPERARAVAGCRRGFSGLEDDLSSVQEREPEIIRHGPAEQCLVRQRDDDRGNRRKRANRDETKIRTCEHDAAIS